MPPTLTNELRALETEIFEIEDVNNGTELTDMLADELALAACSSSCSCSSCCSCSTSSCCSCSTSTSSCG